MAFSGFQEFVCLGVLTFLLYRGFLCETQSHLEEAPVL